MVSEVGRELDSEPGSEVSSDAAADRRTFEELVAELEQVARAMDAPDLGIEEAADLYERAGALHRAASQRLATVQERLETLRRQDAPPLGA